MHEGHRQRMRERFLSEGLEGFQEHQALELLLMYAIPQKDVNPLAHEILNRFGTLSAVFSADMDDLMRIPGIKSATASYLRLFGDLFGYLDNLRESERILLKTFPEICRFLEEFLPETGCGALAMLQLASSGRLKKAEMIQGQGEELIQNAVNAAVRNGCEYVILAHRRPSPHGAVSEQDIKLTAAIKDALALIGVFVEDHIILSGSEFTSMRGQRGVGITVAAETGFSSRKKAADPK